VYIFVKKNINRKPDPGLLLQRQINATAMIEITTNTHRHLAARLREEIAHGEWFNGSVEIAVEDPADIVGRLTLTAIIYRRTETLPEGPRRPISDVVPVWWEFSTVGPEGPMPNDFSFDELKPYLIDCD
jgi:hypothetical protein